MPPKIIARNADRTSGVLPVTAAARAAPTRAPSPRLKLEVRRLPPGLTLTEFEETLGEEWKPGNSKVDWREYRQGKTRTPGSGKVPEQSRCYLHFTNESHVKDFEKRFLDVVFHDRAGTYKHNDLKHLAPTLGYAPSQRTPLAQPKKRTDNRQGTIDQDPEFIAFLEAETQPIVKSTAVGGDAEKDGEKVEVKTTPLIEDLREKKANKAKAAMAKAEKAEKDKKVAKGASKDAAVMGEKDGVKGAQQQKGEKEVAKAPAKQGGGKQAQQAKDKSPTKTKKQPPILKPQNAAPNQSTPSSAPLSPAPQRVPPGQRPRGNAEGIKKMLQKDLGIRPKSATSTTQADATPTTTPSSPPPATSTTTPQPASTTAPSKAPAATKRGSTPPPPETKSLPVKAYLKHANPSQGMTEILIQQALSTYGELTNVTIDPRKGTAIAVFKDNESLKKALEAKRVSVGSGAVEVLEFRERSGSGQQGNRGGFRGGRSGRGSARNSGQSGGAGNAATQPAAQ